jgi:hypothetical protein
LSGDGILRGAGQSPHQAMRRNARVAFVLWRAGPPRGHEATPDRTVRRPYWGAANLRDCGHARLVWDVRNESRALSLMSAMEVNSGTAIRRHTPARRMDDAVDPKTPTKAKAPPWGKRGFQCGLARLGGPQMCVCPAAKKVQRGGEARKGFLLQAGRAAARSERVINRNGRQPS